MEALVRFLFEKTGHRIPEGAMESRIEGQDETITLSLGAEEINKFIASDARLVRSFRALLSAAAAASEKRVTLEINEAA